MNISTRDTRDPNVIALDNGSHIDASDEDAVAIGHNAEGEVGLPLTVEAVSQSRLPLRS